MQTDTSPPPAVDVLVVGAGPAGASVARALALQGFSVALSDRARFPRDKPCGEFLSPQCLPYLEQLGLPTLLTDLGANRIDCMRLSGYGQLTTGRFRRLPGRGCHTGTGFGVRRRRFDAALVDAAVAAGVQWLPEHAFGSLQRRGERVVGAVLAARDGRTVPIAARFVVGADGVHSAVARALGWQRRIGWLDQFALVAHFAGLPERTVADVHLLPGGFSAAATVDAGLLSFNLVLPRQQLRHRTEDTWDAFVQHHLRSHPGLAAELGSTQPLARWRGTGPFAFDTIQQTAPGIALVGDAAGYVDPMTGEGIYFALFGAAALSRALATALRDPSAEPSALLDYVRTRRAELGPRLVGSRWLQRLIRAPWLVKPFLAVAAQRPAIADLLVTLTGDTIHPHELLRPSFWRAFLLAS